MSKIIVIGGGAAGMMAAYGAAMCGHQVHLIEKNEKLGKKIYITGKGRCNLTNMAEMEEVMKAVVTNPKFLYSAFYAFGNEAVVDFFESNGMPVKIERGNRAFPESDHSSDVIKTLEKVLREYSVKVSLNTSVKEILQADNKVAGVKLSSGETLKADAVILATGGKSYPATGSTGDGYSFAKKLGHTVVEPAPALVPLTTAEDDIIRMQGLSLRNVQLNVYDESAADYEAVGNKSTKPIYSDFGEMLFTHFGVSGPLVLSASSIVCNELQSKGKLRASIDLKPAITEEQLSARLQRFFEEHPKAHLKAILTELLPSKMIPVFMDRIGIDVQKPACSYTREDREAIIKTLKHFTFTITGTRGFKEAIITRGGISVKEVDPSTMESKLVKGLYIAGELLDLDALTGGFNLQIAWSTGYLAGVSVE